MLKFNLVENLLTPAPNDYMAQVIGVRSYSVEEIVERMLKRGTLITKADVLAVLEVYHNEIADIVSEGEAVHTPIFNTQPSIPGVFDSAADNFDPARHKVRVNINPGLLLRAAAEKIKATKVHVDDPIPYIVEVKDIVSGTVNDMLTLGGVLQLRGSRLKFLPDEPDNGVFLLDDQNGENRCQLIVENKPARIIVVLPDQLPRGNYRIEIRTTYSTAMKPAKTLKRGQFAKILTVN